MPEVSFGSILLMAAAWIPIIVGVSLLVGWMITDDLDVLVGVVGILVLLTAGYLCINPPTPSLPQVLFPALYASYVVVPIILFASNRVSLRGLDMEAVERAYEVLDTRRENAGAQFRLAKSLARVGHLGHALAIAETALQGQDANVFREEFRDLHSWRLARDHGHFQMPPDLACYNCHAPNPAGHPYCKVCGAPHLKALVKGVGFRSGLAGKLFATWLAILALIVMIPPTANYAPPNVAALLIILEVGVPILACLWLWKWRTRA